MYGRIRYAQILFQIINEEHVAIEEVMSLQSQCGEGRGGEGEGRGRGESDALVRLRTESEVSGGELTSPEQSVSSSE